MNNTSEKRCTAHGPFDCIRFPFGWLSFNYIMSIEKSLNNLVNKMCRETIFLKKLFDQNIKNCNVQHDKKLLDVT